MNNKIKIVIGLIMTGLFLLPSVMAATNVIGIVDIDYLIGQNITTLNATGTSYVFFINATGAVTATMSQVPIDINIFGVRLLEKYSGRMLERTCPGWIKY